MLSTMYKIAIPQRIRSYLSIFSSILDESLPQNPQSLQQFLPQFNERLIQHAHTLLRAQKEIVREPLINKTLAHIPELLSHGGKRVRPYMAYIAYISLGGTNARKFYTLAIALELFHTFALIHDDIIDQSQTRHDTDTIHAHLKKILHIEHTRAAESLALLAGDLVFSWSQMLITQLQDESVSRLYQHMVEQIVAGQMLDVVITTQKSASLHTIEKKNRLKTSLYTFVNPMLLGAALQGDSSRNDFFELIGTKLGEAFQTQDDLLDVIGDESKTGKKRFRDIEGGQHTRLTHFVTHHGNEHDKNMFATLFGRPVDEHSSKVLQHIFENSGALANARAHIAAELSAARTLVQEAHFSPEIAAVWYEVINKIEHRSS
jgi:geranylgeranyl diphosphate synthase type I